MLALFYIFVFEKCKQKSTDIVSLYGGIIARASDSFYCCDESMSHSLILYWNFEKRKQKKGGVTDNGAVEVVCVRHDFVFSTR